AGILAAPCNVVENFAQRDAERRQFMRQVEDFAELTVPADEGELLVEHRDALTDVIERGLENFAVVVDRRTGVVEQLERRLGGERALADQEREHEAGRSGTDRRGQQILAVLQKLDVGFGLRIEANAARGGEIRK